MYKMSKLSPAFIILIFSIGIIQAQNIPFTLSYPIAGWGRTKNLVQREQRSPAIFCMCIRQLFAV